MVTDRCVHGIPTFLLCKKCEKAIDDDERLRKKIERAVAAERKRCLAWVNAYDNGWDWKKLIKGIESGEEAPR